MAMTAKRDKNGKIVSLTFNSTGMPFRIKDVMHLVQPDSDKDEDARVVQKVGQFGAGLVSTQVLFNQKGFNKQWQTEQVAKAMTRTDVLGSILIPW